jgi:hypothetical protein
MICNIDSKGRKLRGISGLFCLVAGIALLGAAFALRGLFWPLAMSGAIIALCGGFQIFESLKGWCIVRAMGFKTRW